MSLKTYKTAVCAGALMSAVAWSGGVFAGISQNFESDMTGITGTGGSIGAGSVGTIPCGRPGTVGADLKVLAITGTVTYAESDTPSSNASQVDLMFKAEPTDELDDLADQTDIKVALAVGPAEEGAATVPVKLWCKANGASTASWVALCSVPNASWARATLVLDYATERCRVSINGDPQVTANAAADAWYTFANGKGSDNYLKSVTMVGSTEVDDFVVSHSALDSYVEPFSGVVDLASTGKTITYDELNTYGITVAQATEDVVLNADSGMKISEKIDAGLNPKSATKFEMKTMSTTSATAATITFPGNNASYTVTATDAAGTTVYETATVSQSATADANGEKTNTATFSNLPDNDLIYFHLKTN